MIEGQWRDWLLDFTPTTYKILRQISKRKYVHYFGPEAELYNLDSDPGEEENLINSAPHQRELTRMRGLLADWMRQSNDVFQIDQIYDWLVYRTYENYWGVYQIGEV